ncbi:MAG: hypothetical protein AAGB93_14035 [Planctomycetota bacterium]
MNETTKEILKFVVVFGSLPWVWPFLRSLVKDLIYALEEDGGLLGDPPTQAKLREIRARRAKEPDPLVNELLAHVREQREREATASGSSDRVTGP